MLLFLDRLVGLFSVSFFYCLVTISTHVTSHADHGKAKRLLHLRLGLCRFGGNRRKKVEELFDNSSGPTVPVACKTFC